MQHQQGAPQLCQSPIERRRGDIVEERLADGEGTTGKAHFGLAGALDFLAAAFELMDHMRRIGGSADRGNGADFRDAIGCGDHGGPAEGMPHQQRRGHPPRTQGIGGGDQIVGIGGEGLIREFAFGMTQPGEIEPQHRQAIRRELPRDSA